MMQGWILREKLLGKGGEVLLPTWVTAKLLQSSVVARRKSELQPGGEVGLSTGDTICWEETCT